ncbi:hypothetical protein EV196_103449 [Mariniflexile fucanivorans]|uniref:DUF4276 family protein n=1 Tax=Mariniflexile fucanivorans TaxID=264023 RepID=A0A4R1RLP1_9FLAO|nr:hypothetical protein [Mariniflexile fucanivorans]TCL67026.1 hypothetical protein EV196_103449 [Mariniflexile fucanivorans]
MNLYFILEGEKTEVLLYPKWINYVLPNYSEVDFENQATQDCYYIFSGGGIPSIYNHTINAIKNINDNPIYDKLIVCLDGEEIGVDARIDEIKNHINHSGVHLNNNCEIHFVVQNICIETWFLGNRKIVKKVPVGLKLRDFIEHYNITEEDPELMDKMEMYRNKAHFHYSYFKEILKEHNLIYRKSKPTIVMEKSYFQQLEKRVDETEHLPTFKQLIDLLYSFV